MKKVNLKIGDLNAQKEFKKKHKDFIQCLPILEKAITTAFANDKKESNLNDALVHDLSIEGIYRYSEIGYLVGNGLGDASFIIVRSMFEYLITAQYLHKYPEKSSDFVDYLYIHMRKVFSQIKETYGELPQSKSFEKTVELNYQKVKQRFSYKDRKGKTKFKQTWSDKNMVKMAIDVGLGELIVPAYYLGLEVAHPSIATIVNSKKLPQEKASQALMIAHRMVIDILKLQYEHFGIEELKPLIGQCLRDFKNIWGKYINSLDDEQEEGL